MTQTFISDLSTDGRGVARVDGTVYFVPRALPGDSVELELNTATKPPSATVLARLAPSADRVEHPCPHAGECAGSLWGSLDYGKQLEHKRGLVERTLRKAVGEVEILPAIASPLPWRYRNRISLSVWQKGERLEAGFHTEARQESGVAIGTCLLPFATIGEAVRGLVAVLSTLPARSVSAPRRIQIHDTAVGAGMLLLFATTPPEAVTQRWAELLKRRAPGGIWFAEATAAGVILKTQSITHTNHAAPISTHWLGHDVEVHPAAFSQTNASAANLVGERLVRYGAEQRYGKVWDLYGGFGALGLAAAKGRALTVFEVTRLSERSMLALSEAMGQRNARFVGGDLLRSLPAHVSQFAADDLVVLDPPRSGAHGEVLAMIGRSKVRRVAYLSCNPAKLARDMTALTTAGFRAEELQPYDFFPQTPAIEVLALFERTR